MSCTKVFPVSCSAGTRESSTVEIDTRKTGSQTRGRAKENKDSTQEKEDRGRRRRETGEDKQGDEGGGEEEVRRRQKRSTRRKKQSRSQEHGNIYWCWHGRVSKFTACSKLPASATTLLTRFRAWTLHSLDVATSQGF